MTNEWGPLGPLAEGTSDIQRLVISRQILEE